LLALAAATNEIMAISDKTKLSQAIAAKATGITGADYAWLGLITPESGILHTYSFSSPDKIYLESLSLADSAAAPTPELFALENLAPALTSAPWPPGLSPQWTERMGKLKANSALALPVAASNGELLGVLTLLSADKTHFAEQRIELYQIFCNIIAVCLENLQILTALEMKVEDRTKELKFQKIVAEDARMLAETANRAKTEFLANMSHELRTPLNVILGCSDILLEEMYGNLNDKQREHQNYIKTSAQHLLSLINDILDLSKIEYGKMELRRTELNLKTILENTVKILGERSLRANVRIQFKPPHQEACKFMADERKLKQIIYNLASNAIKFSPPNSTVELSGELLRSPAGLPPNAIKKLSPGQSYILIQVKDNGIGIKPEDLGK
ncbi:MAG TPA: histidine kinase dimerization/phospho-acceptor domain-containing protein, partial [Elusimicrobiales bacterium]|nr:histidine kinase dimerization/phospho-acceptor domain-containing protein [Elusimicrobiales bacterium]